MLEKDGAGFAQLVLGQMREQRLYDPGDPVVEGQRYTSADGNIGHSVAIDYFGQGSAFSDLSLKRLDTWPDNSSVATAHDLCGDRSRSG